MILIPQDLSAINEAYLKRIFGDKPITQIDTPAGPIYYNIGAGGGSINVTTYIVVR